MAEHNLMDYSLLLITEINPDYKETNRGSSERSLKSAEIVANRKETMPLLRKMPSGIPEVQEDLEDELDDEDDLKFNQALQEKLD